MSELVELPKATGESAGQTATSRLRALQQHYQIADNGCGVSGLLDEEPSAFSLLMDAVEPLRNAFGVRVLHLRVQYSEDAGLLKVGVQLPIEFDDPEQALQSFDRSWWLDNCNRSGGPLVFDYEIQSGV